RAQILVHHLLDRIVGRQGDQGLDIDVRPFHRSRPAAQRRGQHQVRGKNGAPPDARLAVEEGTEAGVELSMLDRAPDFGAVQVDHESWATAAKALSWRKEKFMAAFAVVRARQKARRVNLFQFKGDSAWLSLLSFPCAGRRGATA